MFIGETIMDGSRELEVHALSPTAAIITVDDWRRISARLHHAEEELECIHKWLDMHGAPRADKGGEVFSLVGRVKWLVDA